MSEGLVCPRVQCCTISLLLIITEEIITLTLIAHLSSPLKGLVVVLRADKSILFSALNKLMKTLDIVLLRLISVTKTRNIPPTPSNNHQQDPDSDSFVQSQSIESWCLPGHLRMSADSDCVKWFSWQQFFCVNNYFLFFFWCSHQEQLA